jgi:hypothetical protein
VTISFDQLPRWYLLDGNMIPRPCDLATFAARYPNDPNNVIAVDNIYSHPEDTEHYRIETWFLGVMTDPGEYPPNLFATYVFYGTELVDFHPSNTAEEAVLVHDQTKYQHASL